MSPAIPYMQNTTMRRESQFIITFANNAQDPLYTKCVSNFRIYNTIRSQRNFGSREGSS